MENPLDPSMQREVSAIIRRTSELFETNILHEGNNAVYAKSVLIEILVHMKDLLKQSQIHLKKKVDFTDDVVVDERLKIHDVTDLICNFRDALCHNDSFRRKFGSNYIGFGMMVGKVNLMKIGDVEIGNKYDDEVAYCVGRNVLYLNRHLVRAFNEVVNNFSLHI